MKLLWKWLPSAASLLFAATSLQAQGIKVVVDGEPVSFKGAQPRMMRNQVMVPLRGVLERLGATVNFTKSTQTLNIFKNDKTIIMKVNDDYASVNGDTVNLYAPAVYYKGNVMIPLRFLTDALGANVRWDADVQTVHVDIGSGLVGVFL